MHDKTVIRRTQFFGLEQNYNPNLNMFFLYFIIWFVHSILSNRFHNWIKHILWRLDCKLDLFSMLPLNLVFLCFSRQGSSHRSCIYRQFCPTILLQCYLEITFLRQEMSAQVLISATRLSLR